MVRTIAVAGNFELRRKCYICDHTYTTHDIEIVKWTKDGYCYTIAEFGLDEGDAYLASCGNRLLDAIEDENDLMNIKRLDKIGRGIMETTERILEDD